MNWLDPKAVIEHLRETGEDYLAAVIPTPSDPLRGRTPAGETASPDIREGGLNAGLLLVKRNGECGVLTTRVAEAVLNAGVLQQKEITICIGATSQTLMELCERRGDPQRGGPS